MNPPVTQIIASHLLFLFVRDKKIAANQRPGFLPENNSPTCLSRGFEVSYTRDEDFPEPPASGNPNPECTKPRTRVTNIKEYYFCNVRAVRHQFYLIYCLFISYVNVNNYVSLFFTVSVHCSLGCHTAEKH
jgi:hypothetical protein